MHTYSPPSSLVPVSVMRGEDDEDTRLLFESSRTARDYLSSQAWCRGLVTELFGFGVGGVVAVFLFEIDPADVDIDRWLWVVCGDLPTAHLVTDVAADARTALAVYCDLMTAWCDSVRRSDDAADVFPVRADRTIAMADALDRRIAFLRAEVVPRAAAVDG